MVGRQVVAIFHVLWWLQSKGTLMTDVEKARLLFRDAGLAFPAIPVELAAQLKQRGRWVFSTRPLATCLRITFSTM